ncbi:hypothetical protein BCR34DRAFT_661602 [Clohesyomyces aquaticus]|uniref:Uncharacterized protein n=1 Tax=Clohesyomyces aquaticus TaxID=1231657 RepID=A0A1Y2A1E7_9PLEO|nr:hypothetical protein BCR34DRAFT_661602 [Clohesyomyces aquaticus]
MLNRKLQKLIRRLSRRNPSGKKHQPPQNDCPRRSPRLSSGLYTPRYPQKAENIFQSQLALSRQPTGSRSDGEPNWPLVDPRKSIKYPWRTSSDSEDTCLDRIFRTIDEDIYPGDDEMDIERIVFRQAWAVSLGLAGSFGSYYNGFVHATVVQLCRGDVW